MIDGELASLVKELRETCNYILELPDKLFSLVAEYKIKSLSRQERINALKELVELREIGKILQNMYFWKGDFIGFVKGIETSENASINNEDIKYIKEVFLCISEGLKELNITLSETAFSNTQLATDASLFIGKAIHQYNSLAALSDSQLVECGSLVEICTSVEEITKNGTALIERLDEERRLLDHTYG